MILTCGSGCVNVEILVVGKWCPGYLEDVWYVPDIGRHLFSAWNATEQRISVVIKRQQVLLQHHGQLVTTGGWMTDTYATDRHVVVPREPVEVNIATTSEILQLWHECLGHQDECHKRKVLEWMEFNISMAETEGLCDGCVLGKHTGSL
jgi:hypothetical protein